MDDILGSEKAAGLAHILKNDGVGLLGIHTGVLAGVIGVPALIVHGHHHVHAVAPAGLIVVRAEAGRRVDAARAGIHGDIVGQQQTGGLVQEGVLCQHIFKEGAGVGLDNLVFGKPADAHDLFSQGLSHDIYLAVGGLYKGVALVGVQGDGQVSGQSPDGGGPDDEVELGVIHARELSQIVVHGEFDIYGGAGVVMILYLGLGQSGLVLGAPVHGLQALVDIALFEHLAEDLDLLGLKAGVHGLVGMLPVADDAHALEALHLHVDIVLGKLVAGGAELRHAHLFAVQLVLLDDGGLYGHTVVVPAGDIGGIVAPHGIGAGDKILQRLIQGVAHVQIAVGEGRAVMEVEKRLALVLFQHHVVDVQLLPVIQHIRLALCQRSPHGKIGFREVECGVKIL